MSNTVKTMINHTLDQIYANLAVAGSKGVTVEEAQAYIDGLVLELKDIKMQKSKTRNLPPEQKIALYKKAGYTEQHDFTDDKTAPYVLLVRPDDMAKARVYFPTE